jgi:hypothetical protein
MGNWGNGPLGKIDVIDLLETFNVQLQKHPNLEWDLEHWSP